MSLYSFGVAFARLLKNRETSVEINLSYMLKEERQAFIMKQINVHNKVLSTDLSEMLSVSEDTIRRDLKELSESGKVLRVHGGALSQSFHYPFRNDHEIYALDAKHRIADKAISLLKNDMVVLTGGGTTMIELAKKIPDELRATFFTISPLVALELVEHPNLTVISIGGQLSKEAHVNLGSGVINALADIQVDLCLLGANSFSPKEGITDSDWEVVQVKRAMIRSAHKMAILCIAEKLNTTQRLKICDIGQIHYLITELSPENNLLFPYTSTDLTIL